MPTLTGVESSTPIFVKYACRISSALACLIYAPQVAQYRVVCTSLFTAIKSPKVEHLGQVFSVEHFTILCTILSPPFS